MIGLFKLINFFKNLFNKILSKYRYRNCYVKIISGTGKDQCMKIKNFNRKTNICNIYSNWEVQPDSTSEFTYIKKDSLFQKIIKKLGGHKIG